jgi:DNA polymerase alpha subunit B
MPMVKKYFGDEGGGRRTEIILIPSPNDAISEPVFPQWPIPASQFEFNTGGDDFTPLFRRITVLPNPATFVVGDVVFGATSVDLLSHLNAEATPPAKVSAGAPPGSKGPDRFESLVRSVLGQRSFYPLFPTGGGAAGTGEGALPLELTKVWHAGMNVCPDVLILPTRRLGKPACVRAVGETLVVNPGPVARAAAGARAAGMFAKVCIFAGGKPSVSGQMTEDGEDFAVAAALSRLRAEVVKLE